MRLAHIRSEIPGEMNTTLLKLADAMLSEGARVVGAVQVNTVVDPAAPCDMDLRLLPKGPVLRISQRLGAGSTGCRLDPARLEEAVQECSVRLATGADLVIVNKFGSHEAEGRGFRDLIAEALAENVPVVVGVTSGKINEFQDFIGDIGEELPCDVDTLQTWSRAGS